jgi:hypothetical protein
MNITLNFPNPLKKGVVQKYAEVVGLTKEPPLECFKGQIFSQVGTCGNIRVAVTEKRNRIVISTNYMNAHMRSYQLLELAEAAVPLGDIPVVEFSQEFAHMDLSPWFPGGKRENNHIYFTGE